MNFAWVSMDAFTADVNKIGIPTLGSGAFFEQPVTNMNVVSSVAGIVGGANLAGGNIEFWPSNSSPANSAAVPNASSAAYDWGDTPAQGNYGSMQVHNHDARQVIFAFNRWGGAGGVADVGIGNRAGNYLDWTFAQNATTYAVKTLQVYVLPSPSPLRIDPVVFNGSTPFSLQWQAQPGIGYSVYKTLSLDAPAWTRIGGVLAITNIAGFTDSQQADPAGFYRVGTP